jgi:hypothetical protein
LERKGYIEKMEEEHKKIEKITFAFLEECKRNGLSVYDVKQALSEIESSLEFYTTLNSGLKLPL